MVTPYYSLFHERTIADLWYDVVVGIWQKGILEYREGWKQHCKTLRNILMIADDTTTDRINPNAPVSEEFATQYFLEEIWSAERGDYAYTYGERMRKPIDQLEEVIRILKEDMTSRRAVVEIGRPEDLRLDDPACMRLIKFDIEQKALRLNAYCVFRSWDAYKALPANLYAIALLQEYVAKELDVDVGRMSAYGIDVHIYERDLRLVKDLFETRRAKWFEEVKESE